MTEYEYTFERCLKEDDHTYVKRDADGQLYEALKNGKFCYVLDSRRTGKSSLRVRIMAQLRENEIDSVFIDLTKIGAKNVTLSQWYSSQIQVIINDLKLDINLNEWWQNKPTSDLTKYSTFIEEVVLTQKKNNIVIFIDEIDTVLSLDLPTDDFFAFIRSCCEKRPHNPEYNNRLTFCLLGAASPNDLIRDKNRTPFNIGQAITLKPFTHDLDLNPLISGLPEKFNGRQKLMEDILKWTGGQPFLTQKLCQLMVEESKKDNADSVDDVVKSKIINTWKTNQDVVSTHLGHIESRLVGEKWSLRLLNLYKEVLLKNVNDITKYDKYDQMRLKLSGIILSEDGRSLSVYNPIYERIFNLEWVDEQLAKIRPYSAKFENWREAPEKIKRRYLLYGRELEDALKWKEGKNLQEEDNKFLNESENFLQRIQTAFPEGSEPEAIIEAVTSWTGGIKIFDDYIIKNAREEDVPPEQGKEEEWVGTKLNPKGAIYKRNETKEEQSKISDRLFQNSTIDPVSLLSIYKQILNQEEVNFNDSPEHKKLIEMCLVMKEDNKLRILCEIYRRIFNQDWVDEQLARFCPYRKSFIDWKKSDQKESCLLQEQELQKALDWIQDKDYLDELEVKFIITSLVWEMWKSQRMFEKSDTVEIVQNFLPQLKKKTNAPYNIIREILKWTKFEPSLVESLLKWVCDPKVNIPVGNEVKSIEQRTMFRYLLQTWIVAYEKAIVNKEVTFAKKAIDKAFFEAVENWTQRLYSLGYLEEIKGREFNTIEACINHYIDNLIKGGMWGDEERPLVQRTDEGENVFMVTVSNCAYKEGCKWGLGVPEFRKNGKYRCQRLGCFVGAVKKYMSESNLPEDKREKLEYLMTTVMDEKEGCKGFIFINENFMQKLLLNKYPTQLPN